MISVVVLFRNARTLAANCLKSLLAARSAYDAAGGVEYVFIDDHSDPGREIVPLLLEFRAAVAPADVRIVRFARQMHYNHGLAYAFSLARGDYILFVSHDMIVTADCVAALLDVASSDPAIGIVRPTSQHMDWSKQLRLAPPNPLTTMDDVIAFSAQARSRFGTEAVDWPMLIGDAMLVKRSVVDRIGVFDTRFFGFMGDIDYGLRARRAGFRHVIARGAWLSHEGNGTAKENAAQGGESVPDQGRKMLALVETAYAQFRKKWGEDNLPTHFRAMKATHFEALHALPPLPGGELQPPLTMMDDVGTIL